MGSTMRIGDLASAFAAWGCSPGWLPTVRQLGSRRAALLLAVSALTIAAPARPVVAGEGNWSSAPVVFAIPAQPLERALLAYGTAARIQILYDASLVAGKYSTALQGRYPPQQALELLLRGTGLRVRYASPTAVTLASVTEQPRQLLALETMRVEAAPMVIGDSRRFNAYGDALQGRIIAALRRDPIAGRGRYDVTIRVWIAGDGGIERMELSRSSGRPAQDQAILDAVRGAGKGQAPPPGMPQPVSFRFQARPAN